MKPKTVVWTRPTSYDYIGSGGTIFGGSAVSEFDPSYNTFAYVGSGGVAFGGAAAASFFSPNRYTYVGSGGTVFSGSAATEALPALLKSTFTIFRPVDSPLRAFFEIVPSGRMSDGLTPILATFDVHGPRDAISAWFDVIPAALVRARKKVS